jgi:hypothetical protein
MQAIAELLGSLPPLLGQARWRDQGLGADLLPEFIRAARNRLQQGASASLGARDSTDGSNGIAAIAALGAALSALRAVLRQEWVAEFVSAAMAAARREAAALPAEADAPSPSPATAAPIAAALASWKASGLGSGVQNWLLSAGTSGAQFGAEEAGLYLRSLQQLGWADREWVASFVADVVRPLLASSTGRVSRGLSVCVCVCVGGGGG